MRPVRQLVSPPTFPFHLALFKPLPYAAFTLVSRGMLRCCVLLLLVPQSFWRIIFTAPGNWNEMSAWFCSLHWHWTAVPCSGPFCFPFPQCKPIYALSRLADSLVRIHSSLILVSFARGLPLLVVWTVNGLAWVCFAPMTTLSTEQSQLTRGTLLTAPRCSILSSCQFTVASQLTVPSCQFS